MSNWTYVSGSVGIERGPYYTKLTKEGYIKFCESGFFEGFADLYLPYPDEQFKFLESEPIVITGKNGKLTAGLKHRIEVSSFPIIKRDIEELMKTMPSGEQDIIFYMLQEANFHRGSSSQFNSRQTEKLFRDTAMKKFPLWANCSWKEYMRFLPTELDWEDSKDDAILSIHDSIRYCDAEKFYHSLINVFSILVEKDYVFNHGSFTFSDSYIDEYYLELESDHINVTITNRETGETRCEYYQVFEYRDLSDPKDYKKRYPSRSTLRKVDKVFDDIYPVLEDCFPEEEKE